MATTLYQIYNYNFTISPFKLTISKSKILLLFFTSPVSIFLF